jgi:hypothetical protein
MLIRGERATGLIGAAQSMRERLKEIEREGKKERERLVRELRKPK